MRYDFCCTIRDTDAGYKLVVDLECEVEISFDLSDGPTVDGVYLDGQSLFASSDEFTKWLAKRVADEAESDLSSGGRLYQQVLEAEGISYRGLGGNDPHGRFVRVA